MFSYLKAKNVLIITIEHFHDQTILGFEYSQPTDCKLSGLPLMAIQTCIIIIDNISGTF